MAIVRLAPPSPPAHSRTDPTCAAPRRPPRPAAEFKCELAVFELYHQTGNMVLLELLNKPAVTGSDEAGVLV